MWPSKHPSFHLPEWKGPIRPLELKWVQLGKWPVLVIRPEEAYLKSLLSTGLSLKNKSALVTIGGADFKLRFAESIWRLKNLGFKLYATKNTHLFLKT